MRHSAGSGLSPSLSIALATVYRHGPLTPSELADREGVKRPTATRIITALCEQGLVARVDNPDDRRSHRVNVTAEGRALVDEARQRKTAYLAAALDGLSAEDKATLDRAATLLEAILEDRA
jgi:DNA-binding MarR family transcriptional regulator